MSAESTALACDPAKLLIVKELWSVASLGGRCLIVNTNKAGSHELFRVSFAVDTHKAPNGQKLQRKIGGCAVKNDTPATRRQSLEDDLDRELHVEWLARPDARSAVEVSNRVAHRTVAIH